MKDVHENMSFFSIMLHVNDGLGRKKPIRCMWNHKNSLQLLCWNNDKKITWQHRDSNEEEHEESEFKFTIIEFALIRCIRV